MHCERSDAARVACTGATRPAFTAAPYRHEAGQAPRPHIRTFANPVVVLSSTLPTLPEPVAVKKMLLTALALCVASPSLFASDSGDAGSAKAREIHRRSIVLDSHLDTPMFFAQPGWNILERHTWEDDFSQVDYPRMLEGGLDGGFWVIYTAQGERTPQGNLKARDAGLLRLVAIREMVAAHADKFEIALSADDAARIKKAGRRIVYLSIENASPLAADPSLLGTFHQLGVRMLGLVHTLNNDFADSSTDPNGPEWNGLSDKGRALVAEANRLGILIDQSHATDAAFDQIIELSKAPIVLSHSGPAAVHAHARNIDDARIRKLAAKGGVIQINSLSAYLIQTPDIPERRAAMSALYRQFSGDVTLTPAQRKDLARQRREVDARHPVPKATFEDYMKHVLHALEVAGPGHVGIGADWDGGGGVTGLEDVSNLQKITERLLREGYTEAQIEGIWGGNLLRALRAAEQVAARTRA